MPGNGAIKIHRSVTCSNEKKNSTKNNIVVYKCYIKNTYYRINKETTKNRDYCAMLCLDLTRGRKEENKGYPRQCSNKIFWRK